MNLAQLRGFVAVAGEGSFTEAAAALGLTQSGVSHAVASLERELGLTLFTRARDGVTLTTHGEDVLVHAREALRRVDRIAEDAAAAAGQYRGRLRVAGVPSSCPLLAPLIGAFGHRFPDVDVVLLEGSDSEVMHWLRDRVADLGVEVATAATSDGLTLAEDRMVAVLDRGHPLATQASLTLADLTDDPFLLSDGGCEPLLERMHHAAGLTLQPKLRIRDTTTLLALVREHVGVTVIPELSLTDQRGLAAIPIAPPAYRRLILTPADPHDVGPAARAFLDLAAHMTSLPGCGSPGTGTARPPRRPPAR
ncbi:LysR family transcriptional regulator [Amycolatopsis sp. DG1A-15b]|uniref:LysR family transcriptional regulator n=1 Tax=Amycolatopsis sp. DG1A-15b TaxID=3052846 RepID=UPI00255B601C|nr:LysR family transcriptional regulator [Amycolatopsis sp. DG1A-15b]WIX91427.1 LysR family transcriptional regulator [Amycolatopsis sp. DG1A-15b]